jgi:hypothetical protein
MCVKYARPNAPTEPTGIGTTRLVPVVRRRWRYGWEAECSV